MSLWKKLFESKKSSKGRVKKTAKEDVEERIESFLDKERGYQKKNYIEFTNLIEQAKKLNNILGGKLINIKEYFASLKKENPSAYREVVIHMKTKKQEKQE